MVRFIVGFIGFRAGLRVYREYRVHLAYRVYRVSVSGSGVGA